jgi:hypothetical protein
VVEVRDLVLHQFIASVRIRSGKFSGIVAKVPDIYSLDSTKPFRENEDPILNTHKVKPISTPIR